MPRNGVYFVRNNQPNDLSENFGKISLHTDSLSISSSDTSIAKAMQMDYAIPASKIASSSFGEFVGIVVDIPEERIKLKMFHAEIQNDHLAIELEEKAYKEIPVVRSLSPLDVEENYKRIKQDIADLLKTEYGKQSIDPEPQKGSIKKSERSNGEEHQQAFSF